MPPKKKIQRRKRHTKLTDEQRAQISRHIRAFIGLDMFFRATTGKGIPEMIIEVSNAKDQQGPIIPGTQADT